MPITVTITDGTETVKKVIPNAASLRIKKAMDHSVPIDLEENPDETNLEQLMRFFKDRIVRAVTTIERQTAIKTVDTGDIMP